MLTWFYDLETLLMHIDDIRYDSKPVYIRNRRWDPITAVSSASIGAAAETADSAVGVFSKPYEEYRRGQNNPQISNLQGSEDPSLTSTYTPQHNIVSGTSDSNSDTTSKAKAR